MSDIDAIGCLYHISCQLSSPVSYHFPKHLPDPDQRFTEHEKVNDLHMIEQYIQIL